MAIGPEQPYKWGCRRSGERSTFHVVWELTDIGVGPKYLGIQRFRNILWDSKQNHPHSFTLFHFSFDSTPPSHRTLRSACPCSLSSGPYECLTFEPLVDCTGKLQPTSFPMSSSPFMMILIAGTSLRRLVLFLCGLALHDLCSFWTFNHYFSTRKLCSEHLSWQSNSDK